MIDTIESTKFNKWIIMSNESKLEIKLLNLHWIDESNIEDGGSGSDPTHGSDNN
jgi:hypothetical protein